MQTIKSTRVSKVQLEKILFTLRFASSNTKPSPEIQHLKRQLKQDKDLWYIPNRTIAMSTRKASKISDPVCLTSANVLRRDVIPAIPHPLAHTRSSSRLETLAPAPSILNLLHSSHYSQLVTESTTQYQQPCDIPPSTAQQPTDAPITQPASNSSYTRPTLEVNKTLPNKNINMAHAVTTSPSMQPTAVLPVAAAINPSPIISEDVRPFNHKSWKKIQKKNIWEQIASLSIHIIAHVCMYVADNTYLYHPIPCIILRYLHYIASTDTVSTIRGQIT